MNLIHKKILFIPLLLVLFAGSLKSQSVIVTPSVAYIEEGESVELTASGATFFEWSPSTGLSNTEGTSVMATPLTTTTYTVAGYELSDSELVINGDFEMGNTGFTNTYIYGNTGVYNYYYVGHDVIEMWPWDDPGFPVGDHTSGEGLYLMIDSDIGYNSMAWSQSVSVTPNTKYLLSGWFMNVGTTYMRFEINGVSYPEFTPPEERWVWGQRSMIWNSGNNTQAEIKIIVSYAEYGGYDWCVDDISLRELIFVGEAQSTVNVGTPEILLPDNIDSANCVFFPTATEWGIGQPIVSEVAATMCASVPLVGDIDNDGQQEIMMHTDSKVLIFNSNAELKSQFNICSSRIEGQLGIAKVKYTPNEYKTIIVAYSTNNHYFYAYDALGNQLWQSNQPFSSHLSENYQMPAISFADFNHDGWIEMYAGSEIYDAATGVFLGKTNGNMGRAGRTWESYSTYQSSAADLVGDYALELAVGNALYSVDIQSRTDASLNQVSLSCQLESSNMVMADGSTIPFTDGNTFLADFNMDGRLDVLVMNENESNREVYVYVWDVASQSILCSKKITNARKFGMPQIGDLDSDGYPEVCFIVGTYYNHQPGNNETIFALKYNEQSPSGEMEVFWATPHSDFSGATSLTLFDFNQDGISELVYRDENQLRIINGSLVNHQTGAAVSSPYDLATYPCGSGTALEYPIVCDVDMDGEADIIIGSSCNSSSHYGHLYIFKSGGVPWAPARKVWNQYMYNVTNVNMDLTVPQYQFDNATPFTDPEGIVRRPFNNFLQQATTIDQYGRPFYAVPDVEALSASIATGSDNATLEMTYTNQGDNALNAPYSITVFANEMGGSVIQTFTVDTPLAVGDTEQQSLALSFTDLCGVDGLNSLVVAVNCAGSGIAQDGGQQPECDITNNTFQVTINLQGDPTSITETACDQFVWNGIPYTETGDYEQTLQNVFGCDSIVTLHLTIVPTPELIHTPDTIINPGDNVTLTATGADFLYWTDTDDNILSSGSSLTVSPGMSTTYYITGQNVDASLVNNLVVNGDFEQGNVGFTSSYQYTTNLWPAGTYYVGENANNYHSGFVGLGHGGTGNFMIINGAMEAGTNVWTEQIEVTPNTDYAFSSWICNVSVGGPDVVALLQFSINGEQLGEIFSGINQLNIWEQFYVVWNSGNSTTATITILNQNTEEGGNDFGIDDISFIPLTECSVTESIDVIVFSNYYPDNVDSAYCTFLPTATEWSIGDPIISSASALTVTVPMVGDIDDDGQQEILIPDGYYNMNIFRADGTLKSQFSIAGMPGGRALGNIAIAKVKWENNSFKNIIVLLGVNQYLYAYDATGSQLWQSSQPFTSFNGESYPLPTISFADFNHDGWTEVYVGAEIYDAATGVFLCRATGNKGYAGRTWDTQANPYQTFAADLCGNFDLEMAIGNTVYAVDIQSRTDASLNNVTAIRQIPTSSMVMEDNSVIPFTDGNTTIIDINKDGHLDVLVMNVDQDARILYCYIWDVETQNMICTKKIPNTRKFGCPQIGDVDNDGSVEICFITGTYADHGTGDNDLIYALKYNESNTNGAMDVFWTTPHGDNSACTGLTLFDFNQDGYTELVYRDISQMRIINGSLHHHQTGLPVTQPYDMATYPCSSNTQIEYPIIVDVDLDGEAEIIIGGATTMTDYGHLYIFKSGGVPWAPARKVWNQYMYNITNVNKDLAIPQYQFNNATPFTDPDGIVRRPFNNFLQQATTIDQYGRPFYAVPDVEALSASFATDSGSATLDVTYTNQGDNALNAPYSITVFANEVGGNVIQTFSVDTPLAVDSTEQQSLGLSFADLCGIEGLNGLAVAVNCAGGGIAQNGGQQPECDITNNTAMIAITLHADTTYLTETACDSYLWYGDTLTQSGDYQQILQNTFGCDSIVTLNLTVNYSDTTYLDTIVCGSYTWYDSTYVETGIYSYVAQNVDGCDSLLVLNLTVGYAAATDTSAVACDWFDWYGVTYTATGDYDYQTQTVLGCDSIVTLHLTVNYSDTTVLEVAACDGYEWYGDTLTETGLYEWMGQTVEGCDSIVMLQLTVNHSDTTYLDIIACESYEWYDTTYLESGIYSYLAQTVEGCDSLLVLSLTVGHAATSDTTLTVCDWYDWNGVTYTATGDYDYQTQTVMGCDSVATLHLTVNYSDTTYLDPVTACEAYEWYGETYTETGVYAHVLDNAMGCDSVLLLNVTVDYEHYQEDVVAVCYSYDWRGETYTESGEYTDVGPNPMGCDTTFVLRLTIGQDETGDTTAFVCDGFQWYEHYCTSTGQYEHMFQTVIGCDSLVTLDLTYAESFTTAYDTVVCDRYPWPSAPNGFLTETGHYLYEGYTSEGCDSIVDMELTVNYTPDLMIHGHSQVAMTIHYGAFYNYYIADSVELSSCTVTWTCSNPEWIMYVGSDQFKCQIAPITLGQATLTATTHCQSNCDTTYTFEINATHYGVAENGEDGVLLFPNPADNQITIQAPQLIHVRMYDCLGQAVKEMDYDQVETATIEIGNLAQGIYLVEVLTAKGKTMKRLIINK